MNFGQVEVATRTAQTRNQSHPENLMDRGLLAMQICSQPSAASLPS